MGGIHPLLNKILHPFSYQFTCLDIASELRLSISSTLFTLDTDNPSSKSVKIDGKTDGQGQGDCPFKISGRFHYYLSDASPTDNPSRTDNPSLV